MASEWLQGQWQDGRSSRLRPVRVSRDGTWLRAQAEDWPPQRWDFHAVVISPRLGRTPRILKLPDGGRIEVPDSPLLTQWFPSPPGRMERIADWLERRRLAIAASAILTLALVVGMIHSGLPWLAGRAAERMPTSVEKAVSDQAVLMLSSNLSASKLPARQQVRLNAAFRALVADEPRAEQMRLHFVDAPAIGVNAFALPDGRIYITDQLVEKLDSENAVLAVLAHEAGHHVHRHGMRSAIESSSIFVLAGILLGDVSGSSMLVALSGALLANGFSRGHEREADDYAFALLKRHGRSPLDFALAMRRMEEGEHLPASSVLDYISTHPASPERIEAAQKAAQP